MYGRSGGACAEGLYCGTESKCIREPGPGEACGVSNTGQGGYCDSTSHCRDWNNADQLGTCFILGGPGDECESSGEFLTSLGCEPHLRCACVDNDCTSARCALMKEEGESCGDPTTECVKGTECRDGVCVATDELTLFAECLAGDASP
jgi:hypothetical protein